jgi:diguanylate cyclase (GGDEF)-like protein
MSLTLVPPAPVLAPNGAVPAAIPFNEARRLVALRRYGVLDSLPEQAYDDLTELVAAICRVPIALITLIDEHRQWFKSCIGLEGSETKREEAFCAHAILCPDEVMEVPDARLDTRFAHNPFVTGAPHVRFYAGAPLVAPDGVALGTICVIDHKPRKLSTAERTALQALSRQVVSQLELRQTLAGLEVECLTDPLTGLWNRRALDRRLSEEWSRHARKRQPMAMLMVDLDHFKRVNDQFGHPAGDAVLVQAAQVIRRTVRVSDVVARFGGEEFAVILPDTDTNAALAVAEKVRAALEAAGWSQHPVTASVGAASVTPDTRGTAHTLISRADRALYAAKGAGRNQVQPFTGWA